MAEPKHDPAAPRSGPIPLRIEGEPQIVCRPSDPQEEGNGADDHPDDSAAPFSLPADLRRQALANGWGPFLEILEGMEPLPDDFMAERPLNYPWTHRNPFADET